jgi:hypothetical protein
MTNSILLTKLKSGLLLITLLFLTNHAFAANCALPKINDSVTKTCVKANTQAGTIGLAGSGVAKTDVFEVTCETGTQFLTVSVLDKAVPKRSTNLSVQIIKLGSSASSQATDYTDDAKYSALVKLNGAAGPYMVLVNKPSYDGTESANKGAENYIALFSCRSTANRQLGTYVISTQ